MLFQTVWLKEKINDPVPFPALSHAADPGRAVAVPDPTKAAGLVSEPVWVKAV